MKTSNLYLFLIFPFLLIRTLLKRQSYKVEKCNLTDILNMIDKYKNLGEMGEFNRPTQFKQTFIQIQTKYIYRRVKILHIQNMYIKTGKEVQEKFFVPSF